MAGVALLFLVLLPAQDKAPPATDLIVSVRHAFETPMHGEWQPYVCELKNPTKREYHLTIRLYSKVDRVEVTRKHVLRPGDVKRLFLYMPLSAERYYSEGPDFQVVDATGKEIATGKAYIRRETYYESSYGMLVVSRDAAPIHTFSLPERLVSRSLIRSRAQLKTLPDRWVGYSGVNYLLLHDVAIDDLTRPQQRALSEFVRMGGSLILIPGANPAWLKHNAINSLATIKLGESRQVNRLPELEKMIRKFTFHFNSDFRVLDIKNGEWVVREKDFPTLVRYRRGFGAVYVVPFDVRREPFNGWSGMRLWWSSVLRRMARDHQGVEKYSGFAFGRSSQLSVLSEVSQLINASPSFLLLVALAVIFIAAVAPLNYILLRRARVTILITVTVPLISLTFLFLIIGIGYILKGTSTITNTITVLHAVNGADSGMETRMLSIFAPAARSYDIHWDASTVARRIYRSRRVSKPVSVEFGDTFTLRNISANQWEAVPLVGRSIRDLGGGVWFSRSAGMIRVDNQTTWGIKAAIYVDEHGRVCRIGPVAAGGRADKPYLTGKAKPGALDIQPDTLASATLGRFLRGLRSRSRRRKGEPFLLCILDGDPGKVEVDAWISSRSGSIVILQVFPSPADRSP